MDKLVNIFKSNPKEPAVEADKVLEAYLHEVDKLRVNTVNRVKTMYMATRPIYPEWADHQPVV